MGNLTGQQLNLARPKLLRRNLNKRLIVMVHNLEHIYRLKPFLYPLHHTDTFLILAVFLELDESYGVEDLGNLDIDVVDVQALEVLGYGAVGLDLNAVGDVLVVKNGGADCEGA